MRWALTKVWMNPYIRLVVGLLAVVAVASFFLETRSVWNAFLLAYLFAYLLNPFVTLIARLGFSRGLGVLSVAFIFVILLGMLWLLGIQMAAQLAVLIAQLPLMIETLRELPFVLSRAIDPDFGAVFQQVFMNLQAVSTTLTETVLPSITGFRAQGGLTSGLVKIMGGGVQVVFVFVLTVYLLYRFPAYGRSFLELFPARYRHTVKTLADKVSFAVGGYVRGQVLIAAMVGLMVWFGLSLVGVPLASALSLFAAVANIIPFFGPIIASVPTLLIALTVGWGKVIGALIVLLVANQLDAHVLTPMVFSRMISVDPVTIILAILIGSALFGLWGAIIAVPLAVFLKLLYVEYYQTSRWYKRENKDEVVL